MNATNAVRAAPQLRRPLEQASDQPRFGGMLWRLSRRTTALVRPIAGRRWNPVFAVVVHRGRRSGRIYSTPIAARRVGAGFVISLAFGAHVDWYRNIQAASGGEIRWRGRTYRVGAPERLESSSALASFHVVQRVLLRFAGIGGFIRLQDVESPAT